MKKILVPLDGSTLAEKILPYAILLAAHFKAELTLLRVVNGREQGNDQEANAYLEQVRSTILDDKQADGYFVRLLVEQELEGQPTGETLPYTASNQLAHGQVHKQIVQVANQINADLIAMSTHGHSGISRVFSGSVAQHVLHETNLPLLLIHPEEDASPLAEAFKLVPHNFMHRPVMVPLDGKPAAEAILPLTKEVAGECRAPIVLLHIISDWPDTLAMAGAVTVTGGLIGEALDIDRLKEESLQYLREVRKEQLADCPKVEIGILVGEAPTEIVRYIQNHEVGFVVMTTHARTGISRATLGSIADEVIRHTKNHPILIEHPGRRTNNKKG